tara:strand:- start:118 stop:303 length:186 start_codon:yes stop_codon:yes gene_type:complete
MKNYEVTLICIARKTIGVQSSDMDCARDMALDSIDSTDFDLGDWEILELNMDEIEEHHEED